MDCTATRIPYRQTHSFSRIALDYVDHVPALKSFYRYQPSWQGIGQAIEERKKYPTDRQALTAALTEQYKGKGSAAVEQNIQKLKNENCFTVTTAHQNNLFTGPLYFIYKVIHVIRLADELNKIYPANHVVPVFYMGSEDADLAELNHIHLGGEKLEWKTSQQGAVGRMVIDKEIISLIERMEGQLSVLPHGHEMVDKLRLYYKTGSTMQDATFAFVNDLFGEYGLLVLIADTPILKRQMKEIFRQELLAQSSLGIVEKTGLALQDAGYKVQANAREINLFYLEGDRRERLEKHKHEWKVLNSHIHFDEAALVKELEMHPERFSPNVILRGLYQETILPNIAFVGGAGEVAYWLQLKDLFDHYHVHFPVLILRNSFLLIDEKWRTRVSHLGFNLEDIFLNEEELTRKWVDRETSKETSLNGSLVELEKLYEVFKKQATGIDRTLEKHVDALKVQSLHRLQELEKKMYRAEKRKYTDQQRQIRALRAALFPGNGLQERYENISFYYAKYGKEIIEKLYACSLTVEQEFTVVEVR